MYNEWKWERKLGISTLGIEALPEEVSNDLFKQQQFHHYQGASYYILFETFKNLPEQVKTGHFIDYGCGKGRVMVVAAISGFKKISGLDIDERLLIQARKNISVSRSKFQSTEFEALFADATQYEIPADANVLFFFNPFGEDLMRLVAKKVIESLKSYSRKILIVYVNPKFLHVWKEIGAEEKYTLQSKKYFESVILEIS
ncbi:MAG: methyltransferase domain-containing protein [Bacteroidota bacterium]